MYKKIKVTLIFALILVTVFAQSNLVFAGKPTKPTPTPTPTSAVDITTSNLSYNITEDTVVTFDVNATYKSQMYLTWIQLPSNSSTLELLGTDISVQRNKKFTSYTETAHYQFTPSDITEPTTYTYQISATNAANSVDTDLITVTFNVSPVVDSFNYVAFGDSIPSGVSYNGIYKSIIPSYTDQLADYFSGLNPVFTYQDYSVSGFNAIDLYNQLKLESVQQDIRKADVITICIGSNDLMDAAISGTFLGITLYDFYDVDWVKAEAGRADFEDYWPLILAELKDMNINAQLLVTTLYNPYNQIDDMHPLVDAYMWNDSTTQLGINNIISNYQFNTFHPYTVVDVHNLFEDRYGNNKSAVTGFYDNTPFDPHPDHNGQYEIYEIHRTSLK